MKILLSLFLFILSLYGQNYTYLIDEYDKVIDLEAKIITKIAKDITHHKKINLYIPDIKQIDKKVYSTKLNIVNSCQKADFIFVKYDDKNLKCPNIDNKFFFTNNYKKLLNSDKYLGAFFWSKSRPNIVLIKNRLARKQINLKKEYNKFIEDYNEY
ncbi:hypothetical protein [Halarcobacter sp.]|uniref:hypothetical protein n=1 Tax=Halarcobacter sp. TaxID=2321133 RepID=UPI0029F53607|nr:hypothetical protein [Halarcobacter sp.]